MKTGPNIDFMNTWGALWKHTPNIEGATSHTTVGNLRQNLMFYIRVHPCTQKTEQNAFSRSKTGKNEQKKKMLFWLSRSSRRFPSGHIKLWSLSYFNCQLRLCPKSKISLSSIAAFAPPNLKNLSWFNSYFGSAFVALKLTKKKNVILAFSVVATFSLRTHKPLESVWF